MFAGAFLAWAVQDSNLRPPACKAGALPAELTAPGHENRITQTVWRPGHVRGGECRDAVCARFVE